MRLNYIKMIAVIVLPLLFNVSYGQQQEIEALESLGLENIKVVKDGSESYISFQDDVYRGVTRGAAEVLNTLWGVNPTQSYNLLIEENGVPKVAITAATNGSITASYSTQQLVEKLKGERVYNSSFGKLDIILYPELFLENSWLDKLYGVAINISPTAELSLWKGALLTAQVVIPIYTNMQDEKQYIRPGVMTFRQDLRLTNRLYSSLSIGNFTEDRMGVDAEVNYYTRDGGWNFGVRAGVTGSSTFYGGEWEVSRWRRLTWSGWVSYYVPCYNLAIKGEGVQMIYGDRGVRCSIQRYFKDASIGFYAMITDGYTNGGFSYSIPLPGQRRSKRNHSVSVTYPEYFTRTYRARNAIEKLKGFSYETSPNADSFGNFYNPQHINSYINKF